MRGDEDVARQAGVSVATVSKASEPCGSCRQMIREFSVSDTPIYSMHRDPATGRETVFETTISRLLPRAHTHDTFGGKR